MLSGCETGVFVVQREILRPAGVTVSWAGGRAGVRPLFLRCAEPLGCRGHVQGSRALTHYSEKKLWLPDADVCVSWSVVAAATVAVRRASSCVHVLMSGEGLHASRAPGKSMPGSGKWVFSYVSVCHIVS